MYSYIFVSSLVKIIDGKKEWSTVDISDVQLNVLFTLYSKIIVILSNIYLNNNVAVDLSMISPTISGLPITLNQFLIQNGNKTLPTLNSIPTLSKKYLKYNDAFRAGYYILPVNPHTSITTLQHQADKTNLYLTKPNIDYYLMHNTCLVNVNGFFHLTDTDGTGLYVVDGMKTATISNLNQIGIYSFADIGNIQIIPIKTNMVYKQNNIQHYFNNTYIDLGIDTSNKTTLLVLGGYLHTLDDVVYMPINNKSYKINFSNLPLISRYFESKKYIDLSSLPLSKTIRNIDQISISEFYSDENILAYLTLSQSFFILIDNVDIVIEKTPIHKTQLPNMFISYEEPKYPLIVNNGKIVNYWSTYEDKQYSVTCTDSLINNYVYDTVDLNSEYSVDNTKITTNPQSIPDPYFLKISSVNI